MIVDALVAAAVRPACMGTKRVMALFAATARAHAWGRAKFARAGGCGIDAAAHRGRTWSLGHHAVPDGSDRAGPRPPPPPPSANSIRTSRKCASSSPCDAWLSSSLFYLYPLLKCSLSAFLWFAKPVGWPLTSPAACTAIDLHCAARHSLHFALHS